MIELFIDPVLQDSVGGIKDVIIDKESFEGIINVYSVGGALFGFAAHKFMDFLFRVIRTWLEKRFDINFRTQSRRKK